MYVARIPFNNDAQQTSFTSSEKMATIIMVPQHDFGKKKEHDGEKRILCFDVVNIILKMQASDKNVLCIKWIEFRSM